MIKNLIKTLVSLAGRDDATTGELAPSLPQAEAELSAAREAQATAEADYKANLLTADDVAMRRLVEARSDAGVRVDRAIALVEALRERLVVAEAREAEVARMVAYEAAVAEADAARHALAERYPVLARELVRLMETVARAELTVGRVNADLPQGAAAIERVEASVRDVPAVPERIVSEIPVERWVDEGRVMPGPFPQDLVRETERGRGIIRNNSLQISGQTQVELRPFTEQRFYAALGRRWANDLARGLALPGLRADEPDLWRPAEGMIRPAEVLHRIAASRSAEPTLAPRAEVKVRLVPDADARPVKRIERGLAARA